MKQIFSNIPLLPILMGLICGIIISEYVSFIYIIVICFFLFIAYLLKQHITLILLLSAITGWITGEVHSVTPINDKYLNKEYVFSGIVYRTKSNENIRNIVVDITHISDSISTHSITSTKCIIYIPSLNPIVESGDRITFWGSINKIKEYLLADPDYLKEHFKRTSIYNRVPKY